MQLSQADITQQNQHQYSISGTVDFSTVPGLLRRVEDYFKPHRQSSMTQSQDETIAVDMSQVADCNSAALALLFEMVKQACAYNLILRFDNLPATLLTIAKAYGVESEIREICK
jgi:ABC-type transporter Mla MlaB component